MNRTLSVITTAPNKKARAFENIFYPTLTFVGKAEGRPLDLSLLGVPAFPLNIKFG